MVHALGSKPTEVEPVFAALRLARHFHTNAEFWLNLQTFYDLEVSRRSGTVSEIERQVQPAAAPVSFNDQGLKGFTARILMLSEVVRQLDGYLHTWIMRLLDGTLNRGAAEILEQVTERQAEVCTSGSLRRD